MAGVRLSGAIREVRVILCQSSPASAGVRDFISTHYVDLKQENPRTPFLIRECSGVQPVLTTRFSHGREKRAVLDNLSGCEVLEQLKRMDETGLQNAASQGSVV